MTLPINEINEQDFEDEFDDAESGEDNAEESPAGDEMAVDNGPPKDTNGTLLRTLAALVINA